MSKTRKSLRITSWVAALATAGLMASPAVFAASLVSQTLNATSTVNNAGSNTNNAGISGSTLNNAKGNIGANAAAGAGNVQANAAAFVFGLSGTSVGTSATAQQTTAAGISSTTNVANNASLNNAMQGTSGNIGVNVVAGAGNGQANSLMVVGVSGLSGASTFGATQATNGRSSTALGANNAAIGGTALNGASGNIGVNVAAGAGNLQSNSLQMVNPSGFTNPLP